MAKVPRELLEGSTRPDVKDLGGGQVFASQVIEGGQELVWSQAQLLPDEVKAVVILIDLWLQNEDRSLTSLGGNPNLLLQNTCLADRKKGPSKRQLLWAYDFNLAFDEHFRRDRFFEVHVFGGMVKEWPEGFRARMEPRLRQALDQLGEIFDELPMNWLHIDGDDSLPVQLDRERVFSALEIPFKKPEHFWKLP